MQNYQRWVAETAKYPPGLNYPVSSMTSESGECLGILGKHTRRTGKLEVQFAGMDPDHQQAFLEEMGDVLWGMAATLNECGKTFEDLIPINRQKLAKREAEGTLYSDVARLSTDNEQDRLPK